MLKLIPGSLAMTDTGLCKVTFMDDSDSSLRLMEAKFLSPAVLGKELDRMALLASEAIGLKYSIGVIYHNSMGTMVSVVSVDRDGFREERRMALADALSELECTVASKQDKQG
jgi:hypothetical protein